MSDKTFPIFISVACPEYRGAPYPVFDPKKINESHFEDELRFKECDVKLLSESKGEVEWLAQAAFKPTKQFFAEVRRAFKENGMADGGIINIKFGIRDDGLDGAKDYVIEV